MFLDAPRAGLVLVSGYRDPGRQWDLRHDRVPHGQECNPAYRGYPVTAIPFASHHQTRQAADIGGRDLSWALANHRRYGLARTVPSEAWHYEVSGDPQVHIRTYPGPTYDGQHPIPHPSEEFTMDDEAKAAFKAISDHLQRVEAVARAADMRAQRAIDLLEGRPDYKGDPDKDKGFRPVGAASGTWIERERDALARIEEKLDQPAT